MTCTQIQKRHKYPLQCYKAEWYNAVSREKKTKNLKHKTENRACWTDTELSALLSRSYIETPPTNRHWGQEELLIKRTKPIVFQQEIPLHAVAACETRTKKKTTKWVFVCVRRALSINWRIWRTAFGIYYYISVSVCVYDNLVVDVAVFSRVWCWNI